MGEPGFVLGSEAYEVHRLVQSWYFNNASSAEENRLCSVECVNREFKSKEVIVAYFKPRLSTRQGRLRTMFSSDSKARHPDCKLGY